MTTAKNDSPLPEHAYAKATLLLDEAGRDEWLGDTNTIVSETLKAQKLPHQPNDGVVVVWGHRHGHKMLCIATDPLFMGGSLGEVGGAKIAAALMHAHTLAGMGAPAHAPRIVLWLDGGGVRLQEGLAALLAAQGVLRALALAASVCHVVSIVTPRRGCYGAWALVAGLCHHRFMVAGSRLGLNGPQVIAQLCDAPQKQTMDAQTIDAMQGSQRRLAAGLITQEVANTVNAVAQATDLVHRSWPKNAPTEPKHALQPDPPPAGQGPVHHAGWTWLNTLRNAEPPVSYAQGTVVTAIAQLGPLRVLLVTTAPGPHTPHGEMGCAQADALAHVLGNVPYAAASHTHQVIENVDGVVLVVDTPGQAMAYAQEYAGLHQKMAHAFVAGQALAARGCPTAALLVGQGVSGAFLCHGLGCQSVLTLESPAICIRAMANLGVAQVTGRSPKQQAILAQTHDALKTDAAAFVRMGGAQHMLPWPLDPNHHPAALAHIRQALADALQPVGPQTDVRKDLRLGVGLGSRIAAEAVWRALSISALSDSGIAM